MPGRSVDESVDVVADLDALVDQNVHFKLQGKTHTIKPLTAGEAFIVWQNLSKLEVLKSQDQISFTQVLDFYADLFKSVCPEIQRKHVEEMSQTQCAALLQLILDTVTGKAFSESKKKAMIQESPIQLMQP